MTKFDGFGKFKTVCCVISIYITYQYDNTGLKYIFFSCNTSVHLLRSILLSFTHNIIALSNPKIGICFNIYCVLTSGLNSVTLSLSTMFMVSEIFPCTAKLAAFPTSGGIWHIRIIASL
jgi:hypothetical protein